MLCGTTSNNLRFYGKFFRVRPNFHSFYRNKIDIDYSNFPKLNEDELEEQFISGHGPGGSKVNKRQNCVLLKHIPTGIIVKCHDFRLLQDNQKQARERLLVKLDDFYNGDMSVSAQKKRFEKEGLLFKQKKKEKLMEMKKNFKCIIEETNKTDT